MSAVFKKGGKYLRYSENTTHTGRHEKVEWADDLQSATVFNGWPPHRFRNEIDGAERLEAVEARRVVLITNERKLETLQLDDLFERLDKMEGRATLAEAQRDELYRQLRERNMEVFALQLELNRKG